jgi:hypothetical protein
MCGGVTGPAVLTPNLLVQAGQSQYAAFFYASLFGSVALGNILLLQWTLAKWGIRGTICVATAVHACLGWFALPFYTTFVPVDKIGIAICLMCLPEVRGPTILSD